MYRRRLLRFGKFAISAKATLVLLISSSVVGILMNLGTYVQIAATVRQNVRHTLPLPIPVASAIQLKWAPEAKILKVHLIIVSEPIPCFPILCFEASCGASSSVNHVICSLSNRYRFLICSEVRRNCQSKIETRVRNFRLGTYKFGKKIIWVIYN